MVNGEVSNIDEELRNTFIKPYKNYNRYIMYNEANYNVDIIDSRNENQGVVNGEVSNIDEELRNTFFNDKIKRSKLTTLTGYTILRQIKSEINAGKINRDSHFKHNVEKRMDELIAKYEKDGKNGSYLTDNKSLKESHSSKNSSKNSSSSSNKFTYNKLKSMLYDNLYHSDLTSSEARIILKIIHSEIRAGKINRNSHFFKQIVEKRMDELIAKYGKDGKNGSYLTDNKSLKESHSSKNSSKNSSSSSNKFTYNKLKSMLYDNLYHSDLTSSEARIILKIIHSEIRAGKINRNSHFFKQIVEKRMDELIAKYEKNRIFVNKDLHHISNILEPILLDKLKYSKLANLILKQIQFEIEIGEIESEINFKESVEKRMDELIVEYERKLEL